MTARWRGARRELRAVAGMLLDAVKPLTAAQQEALRVSWVAYLADRAALAAVGLSVSTERERVAA